MNKKGQISLGIIIAVFVGVLVGAIFLQIIAQQVGDSINTVTLVNQTNTAGANGEVFNITGYKALSDVVIHNASGGEVIAAGNYTVTNNVVRNGELVVSITVDDAEYESMNWNVSGTAQPTTYISESGGRAVAALITIMFALAVLVVSLTPVMRDKLIDMMRR